VQREHNDGELEAEVMMALALGLGKAVDRELLETIRANDVDTAPGTTFLEAFAAKGGRADELRCILGTETIGAEFVEGALYKNGIPAELSGDVDATICGAFDRAAVAISPEIELLVERTSAGGLIFTCWADFAALVPDYSWFEVGDADGA
jgi:hypothetical protein